MTTVNFQLATHAVKTGYVINANDLSYHYWITAFFSKLYHMIFGGESAYSESALKNRIVRELSSRPVDPSRLEEAKAMIEFAVSLEETLDMKDLGVTAFEMMKGQIERAGREHFAPEEMGAEELQNWTELLQFFGAKSTDPSHQEFGSARSAELTRQVEAFRHKKEAERERAVPLSQAMVLFKNFNPLLSPDRSPPKFSTLLKAWINFTRRNEFRPCLAFIKSIESGESRRFLPPSEYFPLYLVKGNTYTLTIMKVEGSTLIDVVTGERLQCDNFQLLMRWNQHCYRNHTLERRDIPSEILELFQIAKDGPTLMDATSFHKPMWVFHERVKTTKFEHKWSLLLAITKAPSWIENDHLRQWVKGALVNLRKHLPQLEDQKDYAVQIERLQHLLQDYEEKESLRPLPYCAEVTQTFPLEATIGDTRAEPRDVPTIDHEEMSLQESFPKVAVPDRVPDLTTTPDEEGYKAEGKTLQSWVNVCQDLFDRGDFEQLERVSHQFLMQLPHPAQASPFFEELGRISSRRHSRDGDKDSLADFSLDLFEFWDRFFISREKQREIPEEERASTDSYSPNGNLVNYWSIPFFRMTYFALHCQIIKGRLTPSALKPILKGLALHLRLSNIATTQDHHASSPVHTHGMRAVLQGLQNAAADLGEEGGEILELLKVFREAHSIADLHGEVYKSDPSNYASPIYTCYDQIAACQFYELVAFTQMLCNWVSLTQQWKGLYTGRDYAEKQQVAERAFQEGVEKLKKGQMMRLGYRGGYHSGHAHIIPFHGLFVGEFEFSQEVLQQNVGGTIVGFEHLSRPIANPTLRNLVQMGLITTRNALSRNALGVEAGGYRTVGFDRHQKGSAYEAVQDIESFYPNPLIGENQTQGSVQNEAHELPGLERKLLEELQLMQTSSLSRADNTIRTFAKHPYLLGHALYGKDLQTILSLNLFRDFALYREFENRPDEILGHFERFESIIEFHRERDNKEILVFLFDIRLKMVTLLKRSEAKWDPDVLRLLFHQQEVHETSLRVWMSEGSEVDRGLCARSLLLQALNLEVPLPPLELAKLATAFRNSSIYHDTPEEVIYHLNQMLRSQLPDISKAITEAGGPAAVIHRSGIKGKWAQCDEMTWECGILTYHVDTQELILANEVTAPLPHQLRNNLRLRQLIHQGLDKPYLQKAVSLDGIQGWHVTLDGGYELYYSAHRLDAPLLYRKSEGKTEQLVTVTPHFEGCVPQKALDAFWWKDLVTGECRIEDRSGKEIYKIVDGSLVAMGDDGETYTLLDLKMLRKGKAIFTNFAGVHGVELRQDARGKVTLLYPSLNYSYHWNSKERRWEIDAFPGYSLSPKVASHVMVRRAREQTAVPLFRTSFRGYHLLEGSNPSAPQKLILAPIEYRQKTTPSALQKYQWEPIPTASDVPFKESVCTFDLTSEGELQTQDPNNYLYLAYVLLAQGKEEDALFYLKRGESVAAWDTEKWDVILGWIDRLPAGVSPANKLQFYLTWIRLRSHRREAMSETIRLDEALPKVMEFYEAAKDSLGPTDREAIERLMPRAMPRNREGVILAPETWTPSAQAEELVGQKLSQEAVILTSLEQELEALHRCVTSRPHDFPKDAPPSLDLETVDLTPYIDHGGGEDARVTHLLGELDELFDGEEYVDEIGKGLAKDIRFARDHREATKLKPGVDLAPLKGRYQTLVQKYRCKEEEMKALLLPILQPQPVTHPQELSSAQLRENLKTVENLLDEARLCYLKNDYSSLEEKGIDIAHLDELMGQFLERRTKRKHYERKVKGISDYESGELHESKLVQKLQGQCVYTSCSDPVLVRFLIVTEDTLNLTVRSMQFSSLLDELEHAHAFKHAGTGFGKTTLQRHLILQLKALQGKLAAQLTHNDLFHTHHRALAKTQREAYGATASPFHFTRQQTVDPYQLHQMERQALLVQTTGGCLDHRKSDILSLKHRFTTAVLDKEDFKVIQHFQRLRRHHKTHTEVNSDEFVTVLDPTKDHTFAYGKAVELEPVIFDTCIELFLLMIEDPELRPTYEKYVKGNKLKHLREEEFEDYLRSLAEKFAAKIRCPEAALYLYDDGQSHEVGAFYEDMPRDHEEILRAAHDYIQVFRHSYLKLLGVRFGRSEDGLHTKPFGKSAKCLETSQRSFVPTSIFEACFDYFTEGAFPNGNYQTGVSAFVENKRAEARKEGGDERTSQVAESFRRNYGVELFESGYDPAALKDLIEQNPRLLGDYLRTTYFVPFTHYPKKVVGNSCHVPNQYAAVQGSSGSAERVDTLPHSVHKVESLARQAGDVGEVFLRLMETFDEDAHWIFIDPFQPIEAQVGPHLQRGDVFIDMVPFFPGEKAEQIAVKLRGFSGDTTQNVRFVDEKGVLCCLKDGEPSDETTGVLSQLHVEGTDWKFRNGIISHSKDSALTEFYQAIRMRDLGRGQMAFIASDIDWAEMIRKHPKLEGKSRFAQMVYLLAHNESELLKKRNYIRMQKNIPAICENAVDNLLDTVTDEASLTALRDFPLLRDHYLVQSTPVVVGKMGAPRLSAIPAAQLAASIQIHVRNLGVVLSFIEEREIQCDPQPLRDAIETLNEPTFILPPEKLPAEALSQGFEVEGIEELEIVAEVAQEEVVDQEVDFLTEAIAVQEQHRETETVFRKRKISDEGREDLYNPFTEAVATLFGKDLPDQQNTFQIPNTPFFVSSHVGMHPKGSSVTPENLRDFFWFTGGTEKPVMSPKVVFLKEKGEERSIPILMSVKDADLFLQPHTRIIEAEASDMSWFQEAKDHELEDQLELLVWDLRTPGMPTWAKSEETQNAILLARIAYLDCPFTEEDQKRAQQLMRTAGYDPQKLRPYLAHNYPGMGQHHPLVR